MILLDKDGKPIEVETCVLRGLCRYGKGKTGGITEYADDKRHVYSFSRVPHGIQVVKGLASFVTAGYTHERIKWETRTEQIKSSLVEHERFLKDFNEEERRPFKQTIDKMTIELEELLKNEPIPPDSDNAVYIFSKDLEETIPGAKPTEKKAK